MRKFIAVILSLLLLLTLSGCRFSLKPTYWNGMTKQETEEFILGKLEEKYDEEFEMLGMYPTLSSGFMRTACSPKSDNELVFETELWLSGSFYDTYIQSIVRREMKEAIDSILSKYYDCFASDVYVFGLSSVYDPGIKSSREASISSFTEALSDENYSVIWIAFNEDEIANSYDEVEQHLSEIVKKFYLTNATIDCYFVSNDVINECQKNFENNHAECGYNIILDMDSTLSGKRPIYIFYYKGSSYGLSYVRTVGSREETTGSKEETMDEA